MPRCLFPYLRHVGRARFWLMNVFPHINHHILLLTLTEGSIHAWEMFSVKSRYVPAPNNMNTLKLCRPSSLERYFRFWVTEAPSLWGIPVNFHVSKICRNENLALRSREQCVHVQFILPLKTAYVAPPRMGYVPPKHQFIQEPHNITSQKSAFFVVTAMKNSNLT
jgi:hypothetical protein